MPNEVASMQHNVLIDPKQFEALIINGDCARLTPAQRVQYYIYRCHAIGLDPSTHPFEYISLNGKLVLYAKAQVAQQLAKNRKLSTQIVQTMAMGPDSTMYVVSVRVMSVEDGRFTDNIGAVSTANLKGEALANAYMKATTKAIRRAILAHEGLGMLDESEIEDTDGKVVKMSDDEIDQVAKSTKPTPPPAPIKTPSESEAEQPVGQQDPQVLYNMALNRLVDVAKASGQPEAVLVAIRNKYNAMLAQRGYPDTIREIAASTARASSGGAE